MPKNLSSLKGLRLWDRFLCTMASASEESHKAPDCLALCANRCGFHGSPTTFNLCSKCYREYCLQQEQRLPRIVTSVKAVVDSSSPSSQRSSPAVVSVGSVVGHSRMKNKCEFCEKRVKMMLGFKCRCGGTFCSEHRYPEMHVCFFDFKAVGRDAIAKANPVVKPNKIRRF